MLECTFFGKQARFHHVGLAVKSIREASPASTVTVENTQKVSFAFIRLYGVTLELLEPFGEDSPIAGSLRRGTKLLHLCYEVPNLEEALTLARLAGFHQISRPLPAPAFENRRIVWVYSGQYGLFELLEWSSSPAVNTSEPTSTETCAPPSAVQR